MVALRRAVAAAAVLRLQSRASIARPRSLPVAVSQFRSYTSTNARRQNAFHSQLENTPNADLLRSAQNPATPTVAQNLTEKIFQNYSLNLPAGKKVKSGDYITLAPHYCMTHDNTRAVMNKMYEIGATKIHNKNQLVFTIDHDVQNRSAANLKKYAEIEEYATRHGVYFRGAGEGIGHQLVTEEGFAWPQTVTVASDSHSNTYGGVSALGTPVVRTDAASIWATGTTWMQLPPVAKVNFTGILPPGVGGKDVIVALAALFNKDEVLNHCIEFSGAESIPINDRLTIANMSTEWGALSGIFPVDEMLISWYRAKATTAAMFDTPTKERINHKRIDELVANRMVADPGATYAKELYLNLSTLSPFVAGPNSVKIGNPISKLEAEEIPVDKCYLLSCTNGRSPDFANAAQVFREASKDGVPAKVAPGVKLYLAAASVAEMKASQESGDWAVLEQAGAIILPPGCGACIGLGEGLLEDNEVGVSASNRNFKGRMGSTKAKAYLASPEVVAASAIKGKIAGPGWYQKPEGVEKVIIGEGSGDYVADKTLAIEDALDKILAEAESMIAAAEGSGEESGSPGPADAAEEETLTEVLPGFPERIEGEIIFCDTDNINTDGVYPGKYTYQDNISKEQMAEVCMENYDPEFRTIAKAGDILVVPYSFGIGSSREQAATAILAKGIPLVVAGSFGNIFSRNSINNALMGVEAPRLITRLREFYKADGNNKPLTRRTGWKLVWDLRRSKIVVTEQDGTTWEQKVGEMPPNVQEIIARGGLEKWIKSKIEA